MTASLGNVVPADAERQRMIVVLDGLRQRYIARGGGFAAPSYNEKDHTVELRWERGGRPWVVAWIGGGAERMLLVWRHPSYRESGDDAYLDCARTR